MLLLLLTQGVSAHSIDSLHHALARHTANGDKIGAIKTYRSLGKAYLKQYSYQKALNHYQWALQHANELSSQKWVAKNTYSIGWVYSKMANYPKAITNYLNALDLSEKQEDDALWLKSTHRLAGCFTTLGDYEQSFVYLQDALEKLKHEDEEDNATALLKIYYEIGSNFFYQEKYSKALEYYQRAMKHYHYSADIRYLYDCNDAIGSVYAVMKDTEKAIQYNQKALDIAQEVDYNYGVANAKNNLALSFYNQKLWEESVGLYREAHQIMEKIGDKAGIALNLQGIASVYVQRKEYANAINSLEKAMTISDEIQDKALMKDVYLQLANTYFETGQTEKGFHLQQEHLTIKEELLSEETLQRLATLEAKYEVERAQKEKEIIQLRSKAEVNQMYRLFLVGMGILLLMLLAVGYSRYSVQLKLNNLLEAKNKEISLQNKQLEISNRDLAQFAFVTSHDLKEPLRMIGSYASLLERRYTGVLDQNGKEFLGFISDGVNRMYRLLSDILDYSRINNSNTAKVKTVNATTLVKGVVKNLQASIEESNAKVIINALPDVKANETQLGQLFQNFISNAIKFRGDRTPEVVINCSKQKGEYVFSVADNGIGIDAENANKIFEMFKRLHTREEYEGTGIGLAICKRIVEQHNGRIWVESEYGMGSKFYFTIPVKQEQVSATMISSNMHLAMN